MPIVKISIVKMPIVKMPIIKMPIVKISSISSIVHIHWGRQTFPEPHSCTLKMIVYQNKWVKVEAFQILQYQMCCGGGFISVSQEVAKWPSFPTLIFRVAKCHRYDCVWKIHMLAQYRLSYKELAHIMQDLCMIELAQFELSTSGLKRYLFRCSLPKQCASLRVKFWGEKRREKIAMSVSRSENIAKADAHCQNNVHLLEWNFEEEKKTRTRSVL